MTAVYHQQQSGRKLGISLVIVITVVMAVLVGLILLLFDIENMNQAVLVGMVSVGSLVYLGFFISGILHIIFGGKYEGYLDENIFSWQVPHKVMGESFSIELARIERLVLRYSKGKSSAWAVIVLEDQHEHSISLGQSSKIDVAELFALLAKQSNVRVEREYDT